MNPDTTVLDAAKKTISKKQRILVSSNHSDVIAIITASDMVKAFAKQTSNNPSLESVITKKIFSIDVNDSIYDAVDIMNNRNIGLRLLTIKVQINLLFLSSRHIIC